MGTQYWLTENGMKEIIPLTPREIGSRIYGISGFGGSASGTFAVISAPNEHKCQKLVEIGGSNRFDTLDTEHCRPISEKLGIGTYWDDIEPDFRFSAEEIEQAIHEAEAQQERDRIEAERAAEESRLQCERYRKEYSYLTECTRYDVKTASNNIRLVLKHKFPKQKFSVTTRNYDTIYIRWTDGPTSGQVKSAVGRFEGKSFDGMTDYEDMVTSDFITVFGCVGYMFFDREMSDTARDSIMQELNARFERSYAYNDYCIERLRDFETVVFMEFKNKDLSPVSPVGAVEAVQKDGVEIIDYSDKSVAVFGDTKPIKDTLKQLGGRFNPALNRDGEKCAGWVFPKTKEADLRAALRVLE